MQRNFEFIIIVISTNLLKILFKKHFLPGKYLIK